ncbi:hypothetical protein Dimus_030386, partial [Dionaea muscipula]
QRGLVVVGSSAVGEAGGSCSGQAWSSSPDDERGCGLKVVVMMGSGCCRQRWWWNKAAMDDDDRCRQGRGEQSLFLS